MLSVKNLKAGYNDKPIVAIDSYNLSSGEHCLILGQSGTGKTTLLYALAGLLKPLCGQIELNNINVSELNGADLDRFRGRNIGIIYQSLHLSAPLTVLQNLMLVPYAAGLNQDVSWAETLLQKLGIGDLRDRMPHTLSTGQQQRVAIARAAMSNPKFLLGDEPTSALDDDSCATVMRLLLELAQISGASLIIATHDARIKPYFTNIITLEDGA